MRNFTPKFHFFCRATLNVHNVHQFAPLGVTKMLLGLFSRIESHAMLCYRVGLKMKSFQFLVVITCKQPNS